MTTDDPNKRRYYLDNIEVHLPVFWEQYIADDNQLEVIKTHSIPLVISINGHSLVDATQEDFLPPPDNTSSASIRQTESEKVELQGVRKETLQEYQLSQQGGIRESVVIVIALLMLYTSLISPNAVMPWLLTTATGLIAWGSGVYTVALPNAISKKFTAFEAFPSAGDCSENPILGKLTTSL